MSKTKRAALYVRVSTDKQTVQNQIDALTRIAEHRGWEIVETYSDAGISGAKGRKDRPGLDQMLTDASKARFDVVMTWAIDRLGRSLPDLLDTIGNLEAAHVDVFIDQQNMDTTTPAGKLMFTMVGAFAEFERTMIRQRVNAGLARARKAGTKLGRPTIDPATDRLCARPWRAAKASVRRLAKRVARQAPCGGSRPRWLRARRIRARPQHRDHLASRSRLPKRAA